MFVKLSRQNIWMSNMDQTQSIFNAISYTPMYTLLLLLLFEGFNDPENFDQPTESV